MKQMLFLLAVQLQYHDSVRATVKTMRIIHPRECCFASLERVHHHQYIFLHVEPEPVPANVQRPNGTSVAKDVPANLQGYLVYLLASEFG